MARSLLLCLVSLAVLVQCAYAFEDFYCGDQTCYEVLELTRSASIPEIKIAYKKLSLKYHPDKTDLPADKERYIAVRQAYDTLIDPTSRTEYDDILDHPERNFSNYARVYARYYRTNVWSIVVWVLLAATVADWLYRNKRYADIQQLAKMDPKTQFKIKNIKRERLEKRAAAAEAAAKAAPPASPSAAASAKKDKKSAKKLDVNDIPDSEISLAELGIELDGPYAHPPKYSSVLPVRLAQGLVALALNLVWLARWTLLFTVLKRPYGAAEREYLTVQALEISADDWAYTEDASKEELINLELWEEDNMDQLRANQRSMQHSGKKRS